MSAFDSQIPGSQEWTEFRTAFAASRLQAWLIAGLQEHAPNFFSNLEDSFSRASVEAEDRASINPDFDWSEIELPGGVTLVADHDQVREIRAQLLPHRKTSESFPYRARCLSLVAMRSALEAYCKAIGAFERGSLPDSINRWLSLRNGLPEGDYLHLRESDALRHLIVHNRGVVDATFLLRNPWSNMQVGERYPLSDRQLWEHGDTVWSVANRLRSAR